MADTHLTEAECLLEQGTTYRRRIGLKRLAAPGDSIFAGFKPGAFSIYFGDAPIFHFDLEGRWQRAFALGTHYLKGLDGTGQKIDRVREGQNLVLKRAIMADAELNDFDERVRSMAEELTALLKRGNLALAGPTSSEAQSLGQDDLCDFLRTISSWDRPAWLAQRERYRKCYEPMPFLPPECQNSVVLQATLGHAAGAGFGDAQAALATTRSLAEFEQHARDVAALWGRRLSQSRTIYLAGTDVLSRPVAENAARLDEIGRTFLIEPKPRRAGLDRSEGDDRPSFDGVHAFLINFTAPQPDRAGWHELARRGLNRLSLAIESGDPEIRTNYLKSWSDDELRATVADIQASHLGTSVLTLVGAGGVERASSHVDSTARLIQSLNLGPGDFVFLLDENEIRGESPAGLTPLGGTAWSEQQARLKNALAPLKQRGVKVLPYTLEKQRS
jgi:hypothetical protein